MQTTAWGPGHTVLRAENFSRADPGGVHGLSLCFTVPVEECGWLKTSPRLMLWGGVGRQLPQALASVHPAAEL